MLQEIIGDSSPVYPIWATIMMVLSLILVNKKDYQYLLPLGLLGAIIASLIAMISNHIINAWRYVEAEPFSILGIPIFIFIAWFAAIIIFLWALPKENQTWIHYLYISLFSLFGAAIDGLFHNLGIRSYANWYRGWIWFFPLYLIFWINYRIFLFRKKY
ncbi:hypothetical protein MWH28_11975 [Natroniella sulfidigena]|uniref:hypothetical protein n=1 Tax=Natroniella sulfidigena TaxID=723921 RepID=UPI00200A8E86|nr:hypothetical protein [Natroniella sulfidigena]MCK8818076.1 hypothetical protein [Natroniella sulfidigena]